MTTTSPVLDALSLNRYHLKIKGCTAPLDVESFEGREGLSTRYRYDVRLTSSDKDIDPAMMLMKNVTFIMQTLPQTAFRRTLAPEVQRTLYGVITHFSRLSVSRDEATYSLTFEPRLSLLDNSRRSAIYQNLSVPEVVEKILREHHNWPGWLFEFRLSNTYPSREIITQFMLSDAEFIDRLLSEVGIWYNFTQDIETGHEMVVFGDSDRGWQYGVTVPVVNLAGMHDNRAESVWNLQAHHQVTERSVSTHDYNYRTADVIMNADADLTHDDDKTTYGNDYHYTDGFLSEGEQYATAGNQSAESGYFYARLRHERQLNRQHRLSLESNSTLIAPGQVLKAQGDNSRAFAEGMLVTAIETSASRSSHYRLKAKGIAYRSTVCFRPVHQPRARITVPLTARITSSQAGDIYSHIDKQGRYRVRFDFDKDSWPQGGESPWLRRARDYAGDNFGLHLPLIQGTEVAVMFDGGHPDWKISADPQLVSITRSALLRLIGQRNAESALYQKMLQQVSHNYADMRLSDMTGDTDASRLFTTDEVVPGMFTRDAWDNAVQPAIDKVVNERRDEIDWVLTDSKHQVASDISPAALKARLTERYFTDYAGAWLDFLNSLHWQNAATLSDAIDQLTLLADVRQSPLVALMNTLNVQGRAGQTQEALSDSLVKSAQNLLHSDGAKAIDQQAGPHGPLEATFGPTLALLSNQNGGSDSLSLQTFLTRVTRVRLKLQQVTNTADPQAMMQALAQTVFQGKSVDVTDTRDYGSLVAASLGQEWGGFGQALFVQPMEQAWQQVLAPTAESINSQWQQTIVNDWEHDFNDRWPFSPDKQSEASLPLLSQYLRNDTGRITQFVKTSLGGVLHKEGRRWVPDAISSQGLHFNPEFLDALNALSELADVVFTSGDAGVHFQLMGKPARDVMQTTLFLDQQKLDYHNQVESWQPFVWPDSQWKPRTTLTWTSVNTGERIYADYPGSWGFIRLLDKAQVKATDNSTYVLRWKTADGDTLNMILRTEAGVGPLALLRLKGFRLPQQVFETTGAMATRHTESDAGSEE
ncbi:type VI secretion system tip protein VgrG [Cronobacter sakazakii]|nr:MULTISPECIES: type VI secretion system tip protein VgrG [Cronobacter]MCU7759408.1 type VI secretion system tip protein VgrG [Cronobacter sakazakii]MDI7265624.1 type VI secretion system tip protein VgrG [Cronobacter sakazakii]MDI7280903.1 type VI secretion system tip protein VgrG [Cronobacter sakazakii]MDI7286165.1 type VI secretion system tip protein VgrG [Cronobacter sakazakii]MDI7290417.1 type VI secretion system tip protein VgrG [Cronobacter sakazakii]